MKKNIVRIVAALLVAMLALTLIPMGAFAAEAKDGVTVPVDINVYGKYDPTITDQIDSLGSDTYMDGDKIKVKDYDSVHIGADGKLYDFRGFATTEEFQKKASEIWADGTLSDEERIAAIDKIAEKYELSFIKQDVTIDKFPTSTNPKDYDEWYYKWGWVIAGYTPHQHKLSRWYSDGTTHWRECLVCKKLANLGYWEQFMYQNWCQDGDEDGICNVCGGDVPYHDVTVIESEGGKITVNKDTASHRTKITADVEVEEGYKLKKLHFVKVREDGSRQEITRHKLNGQFWTRMPTYELEVSAEFVKK